MASSSLSLQLPRYASSARLGLSALNGRRPSHSARLQPPPTTTTKGLRAVAATSYQHEAAGHAGDNGGIAATSALHLVAGDDDAAAAEPMRASVRVRGGKTRSPKGRPGAPREGSGGKVHAAPPALLGLPQEGPGGQGGSIH